MQKQLSLCLIVFLVFAGSLMTTACSSREVEVSTSKRPRCITTRPTNTGFLKYIQCGFGDKHY